MILDFLTSATVSDTAEYIPGRKGGPRKDRNPVGLAIRVFKDGSTYPSAELVERFNLEFPGAEVKSKEPLPLKEGETEPEYKYEFEVVGDKGNGFDVIDSHYYPTFQIGKRILIISPITRAAPKVDLFASTGYEKDGTPKNSVLTQGAKTFGKDSLLPSIEEVYGIEMGDEQEFVDLMLVPNPATSQPWQLPNGKKITFIPKKVSRGTAQGQISTIRREEPEFWALIPSSILTENQGSDEEDTDSDHDSADDTEMVKQAQVSDELSIVD